MIPESNLKILSFVSLKLMIFTYGGKVGFFGGNVRNILDDLQSVK